MTCLRGSKVGISDPTCENRDLHLISSPSRGRFYVGVSISLNNFSSTQLLKLKRGAHACFSYALSAYTHLADTSCPPKFPGISSLRLQPRPLLPQPDSPVSFYCCPYSPFSCSSQRADLKTQTGLCHFPAKNLNTRSPHFALQDPTWSGFCLLHLCPSSRACWLPIYQRPPPSRLRAFALAVFSPLSFLSPYMGPSCCPAQMSSWREAFPLLSSSSTTEGSPPVTSLSAQRLFKTWDYLACCLFAPQNCPHERWGLAVLLTAGFPGTRTVPGT